LFFGSVAGDQAGCPPAHGAVTVKRGTLKATNFKQCLATEVPAYVAFYRAAPGFSGADEFELEVSLGGGRNSASTFASTSPTVQAPGRAFS
jgi:hypothetical protein